MIIFQQFVMTLFCHDFSTSLVMPVLIKDCMRVTNSKGLTGGELTRLNSSFISTPILVHLIRFVIMMLLYVSGDGEGR